MFCVELAGFVIELDNRFVETEKYCAAYAVSGKQPLFRVSVSQAELAHYCASAAYPVTLPAAESILIYRKLAAILPRYGAFLLHAAVFTYGGKTVALSAPRGTGKTTHLALWQKRFGEKVRVISGDKPLIRLENGNYIAYATPWQGKEGIGTVGACAAPNLLCFLEQGETDSLRFLTPKEGATRLAREVIYPSDSQTQDAFGQLAAGMLKNIPICLLRATPTENAVDLLLQALMRQN